VSETTPSPVLEARGVTKVYGDGTRALDGVDLQVFADETFALVGESGCGKTTLLRLFNRMVEPTEGTVHVEGTDVAELDPVDLRRRIGYVQQEAGLLPHWSVRDNVELVPRLLGWPRERRRQRAEEMLETVRLATDQHATRYPGELSGGQRQRVAFARALAADPDIVLLDEPFGALDALTRLDMQKEFRGLQDQLGKAMVFVTHDLAEAFHLADRMGVMKDGRILQIGTADELETNPEPGYVAKLLELGR